jgi:hypothetical protein
MNDAAARKGLARRRINREDAPGVWYESNHKIAFVRLDTRRPIVVRVPAPTALGHYEPKATTAFAT